MTITTEDILQVRRMTNEPTSTTYTDATISGYLVVADEDKNAVAGEIWGEKASALQATMYDFSADGASYTLSQVFEYAVDRMKSYNSKRVAKTSLWIKDPIETIFRDFTIVNETDEEI